MKAGRFRRRPVEVDAVRWFHNGDHPDDGVGELVIDLVTGRQYTRMEGRIVRFHRRPDVAEIQACQDCGLIMRDHGWIDGRRGGHVVCPGDWVVTDGREHYPCKPEVFAAGYDPVAGR